MIGAFLFPLEALFMHIARSTLGGYNFACFRCRIIQYLCNAHLDFSKISCYLGKTTKC